MKALPGAYDGSNDSTGDPDTGTQGQCENDHNGGKWIPDNGTQMQYNPDPAGRADINVEVSEPVKNSVTDDVVAQVQRIKICGGGGFLYAGIGGHAGPVHGEALTLTEYDSKLGGAHCGLVGIGAGDYTGGVESMRTWNDWKTHTSPIGPGGKGFSAASFKFGQKVGTKTNDVSGLAQYEKGKLSLGGYGGVTMGSGRTFGLGGYFTFGLDSCE